MKKILLFIILVLAACHPKHRRDSAPDLPDMSKHNDQVPVGSRYPIPAKVNSDTGDLPSWKHTAAGDTSKKIKTDTAASSHNKNLK